jgi:hypothetical protein
MIRWAMLTRRATWPDADDDWSIRLDGESVGRIFLDQYGAGRAWRWSVTLPMPCGDGSGWAASYEEAAREWREAWSRQLDRIGPEGLAKGLAISRASRKAQETWARHRRGEATLEPPR